MAAVRQVGLATALGACRCTEGRSCCASRPAALQREECLPKEWPWCQLSALLRTVAPNQPSCDQAQSSTLSQGGAGFLQGALGAGQSAAVDLDGAHTTAARRAASALSLASAPRSMPCREAEHGELARFVEQAVSAGG